MNACILFIATCNRISSVVRVCKYHTYLWYYVLSVTEDHALVDVQTITTPNVNDGHYIRLDSQEKAQGPITLVY